MEGCDREYAVFKFKFLRKKYIMIKIKEELKLLVKQWFSKALGIFDKTNYIKKYFLGNSVFILVRTM